MQASTLVESRRSEGRLITAFSIAFGILAIVVLGLGLYTIFGGEDPVNRFQDSPITSQPK